MFDISAASGIRSMTKMALPARSTPKAQYLSALSVGRLGVGWGLIWSQALGHWIQTLLGVLLNLNKYKINHKL